MAKTIKFNLICDGYPVRTLEDLQEHFSVEDILGYYQNGLLSRWLEVRGYTKEKKLIEEIETEQPDLSIIKELIQVFDIESDKSAIERDTYIFSYRKQLLEKAEEYNRAKKKRESFIDEYYAEYGKIITNILRNKENMSSIKADLQEISTNYRVLFDLDYLVLFKIFQHHAPKAIFAMLMNEYMRTKFAVIGDSGNQVVDTAEKNNISKRADWFANILKSAYEDQVETPDMVAHEIGIKGSVTGDITKDASAIYNAVVELNKPEYLKKILGDDLIIYTGNTEGFAQTLANTGQYLVLWISEDVKVNTYGATRTNLGPGWINNRFQILDGLVYMSQTNTAKIYYLKV